MTGKLKDKDRDGYLITRTWSCVGAGRGRKDNGWYRISTILCDRILASLSH